MPQGFAAFLSVSLRLTKRFRRPRLLPAWLVDRTDRISRAPGSITVPLYYLLTPLKSGSYYRWRHMS